MQHPTFCRTQTVVTSSAQTSAILSTRRATTTGEHLQQPCPRPLYKIVLFTPLRRRTFTAIFKSPSSAITRFDIAGNLGADNSGAARGRRLGTTRSGFTGFYKGVSDLSTDPTINHLILVHNGPDWQQQFSGSTDKDDHSVTGRGVDYLIFILFGGNSTAPIPSVASFSRLQDHVLSRCMSPRGTVCVCDGVQPGGCNTTAAYAVQGPTFGSVRPAATVFPTKAQLVPSGTPGLSTVCVSTAGSAVPSSSRAIIVPSNRFCGSSAALGDNFANCTSNNANVTCGNNNPDMLACSSIPNGYANLRSDTGFVVLCSDACQVYIRRFFSRAVVSRLSTCVDAQIGEDRAKRFTIDFNMVNGNTAISDGGSDSMSPIPRCCFARERSEALVLTLRSIRSV